MFVVAAQHAAFDAKAAAPRYRGRILGLCSFEILWMDDRAPSLIQDSRHRGPDESRGPFVVELQPFIPTHDPDRNRHPISQVLELLVAVIRTGRLPLETQAASRPAHVETCGSQDGFQHAQTLRIVIYNQNHFDTRYTRPLLSG